MHLITLDVEKSKITRKPFWCKNRTDEPQCQQAIHRCEENGVTNLHEPNYVCLQLCKKAYLLSKSKSKYYI